ncbi:hypothetical protein ABE61_01380 [Lysinibacillus sphaericus]|nr:hypothetical protein [Lysinibacillus sphaericus]MBG9479769.1 hypothetical protein [Lysinibacillus sphaericus]MBG9595311.1 hypothetical protein [Lysinibacillus sphaericus]
MALLSIFNIIDLDIHEMIAKFKGLKFAYRGMLNPNKNTFIAKSNDGVLAIYSLDSMSLISKYKVASRIRTLIKIKFLDGKPHVWLSLLYLLPLF